VSEETAARADIHGAVAEGFEPVRDSFAEGFASRGEVGAACCVTVGGRVVADLWGGAARPGVPWQEDTPAVVFSATKGATALVIAALCDRGELDISQRVAAYWPEFGTAGKEPITLRHILTHSSGVIDFPEYPDVIGDAAWWHDLDRVAASWAKAEPAWAPGSAHGYHGASFGHLLGEVVRRATGETLGSALRSLVAEPLGLDLWIGLPQRHHSRVALLIDPPPPTDPLVAAYLSLFTPETLTGRAHLARAGGMEAVGTTFNDPVLWSAEFPSGGGIATARGLAVMYGALTSAAEDASVVSAETLARHTAEAVGGPDLVLLFETRYGLGWQRPTAFTPMGPSDGAFGHGGLGGSLAFADPQRRIGFAYVMNALRFPAAGETTRAGALIDAVYACLP
jgi:CubicO group peptidase (beta-lactamase class C family)